MPDDCVVFIYHQSLPDRWLLFNCMVPDEALRPDATNLRGPCTLFDLVDANGGRHQASLGFSPVVSSVDPRWVSVMGQISHNETAVDIRWEILGSRPALARFSAAGTPVAVLQPQHGRQAGLFAIPARFTLTRLSAHRVLRVIEVRGTTLREEFDGNFREISAELRRTACLSAKTVVNTPVELCQVQGTSFNVTVTPTGDGPSAPSPQRRLWVWLVRVLLGMIGLTLMVVLIRKLATPGKGIAVLSLRSGTALRPADRAGRLGP